MDQPALDQRLGTVGANPPCCSRTAAHLVTLDHKYSRKRRRQAASTDIPQIKEAGCARYCFSRRNRIARKRDTANQKGRGDPLGSSVFGKLLVCLLRVRGWRNGDRARVRI